MNKNNEPLPSEVMQVLLHERATRQIEREMQNEQLRQNQILLEASRERYYDLYEMAPVGYFILSKDGLILEANLTLAKLLGMGKEELSKQSFTHYIHFEDQDIFYFYRNRLLETAEPQVCELRLRKKDGAQFWARLDAAASNDADEQELCRTVVTDITERKLSENKIKEANETMERQLKELTAANKELAGFNYSVAHDMRAPVRHICTFTGILQEHFADIADAEGRDYLHRVYDASWKMGQLIDGLLEFSRMGKAEMREERVNIQNLIQEAIEILEPELKNRCVEWGIGELPDVIGDRILLKSVWINLLANAVKFSRTKQKAKIEIGSLQDLSNSSLVVFFVKDNGVGFDMKYAGKLFGLFQRLHGEREFEGHGVGLVSAQRIIVRHDGEIWAEARLNEGATFYFTLRKWENDLKGGIAT